jgi:hypothetical protein
MNIHPVQLQAEAAHSDDDRRQFGSYHRRRETVVLWDRRSDVASYAKRDGFPRNWLIPDDVQVLVIAGQADFQKPIVDFR